MRGPGSDAGGRHESFADDRPLSHLLAEVVAAREFEQSQLRRKGARSDDVYAARLSTLDALVVYADAIESHAWPIPRSIQQEIRLHRALLRR